ncbi:hypothetical protein N0V90_006381 [Kalmusia sp. IMI 367209]|nr:hypothetical protein N0V90_006381 [Kalmusia sp. IMI 367209]
MDIYKKLPNLRDGQIRLLRIAEWTEAAPGVFCDLTVVFLSDRPDYIALSYTWGLPFLQYEHQEEGGVAEGEAAIPREADVAVVVNGVKTIVGRNLYDFLLHCSRHADPALRGPIWVDALCIDQANLPERGHQVQLMSEIYKDALKVVVWLGAENSSTCASLNLIRAIASVNPAERSQKAHPSQLSPQSTDIISDLKHWVALAEFFQRTWFVRAWIIQEVTFARNITVLCGSCTLRWDELVTVSQFLATSAWSNCFKEGILAKSTGSGTMRTHSIPAKLAATKRTWSSSSSDGLLYALIRCRSSSCQDPRDKVYSQLKLGDADIFPSYKRSVADVYITAAKYILEHTDNLLLLTCVEGAEFQTVPGLPSWVPDWSVTEYLGLRITGYGSFNAAGNLQRTFKITSNDGEHVLSVRAAKIDTIVNAGETKEELQDFSRPTKIWNIVAELSDKYVTNESREEVLWRTLMTNRGNEAHSQSVQYPAMKLNLEDSFRAWVVWRYLVASKKSPSLASSFFPAKTSSDAMFPTKEIIFDCLKHLAEDPNYEAVMANRASVFHTHYSHAMFLRPFSTQQGFFGLGTQALREGDSVWVVPGCRVPLIFRNVECSTRYQLVGGTYLHGFMDGQALKQDGLQFEMVDLE